MQKYYETDKGREKVLNAVSKYQKTHKKEINERSKKYRHYRYFSPDQTKKFKELAERQQHIKKTRKITIGKCYICHKSSNDFKLIEHHITYIPEEKIIMCRSCHDILHNRFLGRKHIVLS